MAPSRDPGKAVAPREGSRGRRRGWRNATEAGLREVGHEPDPRFTFANERTFLAWNRTALALVAGGLVAAELLELGFEAARVIIAISLIGTGAVVAFTSYRRWEVNERRLRLGQPLPYSPFPRYFAAGIGTIAVLAGVLVVVALLGR